MYDDWVLNLLPIHITDNHCSSRHVSCILNLPSRNEVILSLSFIVFSFHVQLDTVLAIYTNIYCQRTCTFRERAAPCSRPETSFLYRVQDSFPWGIAALA